MKKDPATQGDFLAEVMKVGRSSAAWLHVELNRTHAALGREALVHLLDDARNRTGHAESGSMYGCAARSQHPMQSLTDMIHRTASPFLQSTLGAGYPRLLRLVHEFFAKIAVHTETVYTQDHQRCAAPVLLLRTPPDSPNNHQSRERPRPPLHIQARGALPHALVWPHRGSDRCDVHWRAASAARPERGFGGGTDCAQ